MAGVPFIGAEVEGGDRTVRQWWWPSGTISPTVSAMNEGEMIRGGEVAREASASGRRGGGRAWWHAGAWARGGGGGLLEEGEGEGVGVGRAGWEAEAQEDWGG
jgi:hypothetical protein